MSVCRVAAEFGFGVLTNSVQKQQVTGKQVVDQPGDSYFVCMHQIPNCFTAFEDDVDCMADVATNCFVQQIALQQLCPLDSGRDFSIRRPMELGSGLHAECCFDGSVLFVSHPQHQPDSKILYCALKTGLFKIAQHIAGHADHKQVTLTLVENDFRRNTGIGAAESRGKRVLTFSVSAAIFASYLDLLSLVLQVTPVTIQNAAKSLRTV